MNEDLKRKLLADIQRDLKENERDLKRAAERYNELSVERRKLWQGYYEIIGSGLDDNSNSTTNE